MSLNWAKPGHNSAAEYQVSGVPWVTGSMSVDTSTSEKVAFPYVTRWVVITNSDASGGDNLYVAFTDNGVNDNPSGIGVRFVVPPNTVTPRLEVRCKELHFLAAANTVDFSVMAGLTNAQEFPIISGSRGFSGVG